MFQKDMEDFIVIDTEGRQELTEIAIIDSQGKIIYEAFAQESFNDLFNRINVKPLKTIIKEFLILAENKRIICHYAKHDMEVLKRSDTELTGLKFECTYRLSRRYFKNLESYSLEYLSRFLNITVENRHFNPRFAHSSRYDALFTYYLYQKISAENMKMEKKPNPFGSNRVDTPFQNHPDLKNVYKSEFIQLISVLDYVKQDENKQSKGVVVTGDPGSGKTHLMMRLAREKLKSNRLLFIRQPNNPEAVLYHIYSRILESFVEKIPNTRYSQLEYLLGRSFSKIFIDAISKKKTSTKRDEEILGILSKNPLNIYELLGAEGSDIKRKRWEYLEKKMTEWWSEKYGFEGYAVSLIKGLIKFCRYSDERKRDSVRRWLSGNELEPAELESVNLENWKEDISKEEFSLQAITTFGRLSVLDEPLIIVFDQLEGLKYDEKVLSKFGEAIKEIFTHTPHSLIILNLFPDRLEHFQKLFDPATIDRCSQYKIILNLPSEEELKNILKIKAESYQIDINRVFNPDDYKDIFGQESIRKVLNRASDYYRFKIEGIKLPKKVKTFEDKVLSELEKLNRVLAELENLKRMIGTVEKESDKKDQPDSRSENIVEINQPDSKSESEQESSDFIKEYLETQKESLIRDYNRPVTISDSDDWGKLNTVLTAFNEFKKMEMDHLRLGKRTFPDHIFLKNKNVVIGFLNAGSNSFTSRIQNFNEIVVNHKEIKFTLFRDARQPAIRGEVGKKEIEKLNYTKNGKFIIMDKENRIYFELIYKLVTDIQNRDFEADLKDVLKSLPSYLKDYWLMEI